MDENEQSNENDITLDELVSFHNMTPDEQYAYLLKASRNAFAAEWEQKPAITTTTYVGVEYTNIPFERLKPGDRFYLSSHAPVVEYVGYSSETGNLLVKPIHAASSYMRPPYLVVSRHYPRR